MFWVCHVKKYFQNAMSMILDNLNLIFWSFKSNKFDMKKEISPINYVLNIETSLKTRAA